MMRALKGMRQTSVESESFQYNFKQGTRGGTFNKLVNVAHTASINLLNKSIRLK